MLDPEGPFDTDLVKVRFLSECEYTYRANGLGVAVDDLVELPPTSRRPYGRAVGIVTAIGSEYQGPTHPIIRNIPKDESLSEED